MGRRLLSSSNPILAAVVATYALRTYVHRTSYVRTYETRTYVATAAFVGPPLGKAPALLLCVTFGTSRAHRSESVGEPSIKGVIIGRGSQQQQQQLCDLLLVSSRCVVCV